MNLARPHLTTGPELVSASNGPIATSDTYAFRGDHGWRRQRKRIRANSYQFTGRENDGTGLYFYRARYYSPTFQRFVAQDPIGFAGGDANLYDYTSNAPTLLKDPLGLDTGAIGVGFSVQWGSFSVGFNVDLVYDDQGNFGVAMSGSFPLGLPSTGGGVSFVGGANIGYSNAKTICDLGGPFSNVSAGGGDGLGGAVEGYHGSSPDGPVTGVSVTIGGGVGGSAVSGPISLTKVIPLGTVAPPN